MVLNDFMGDNHGLMTACASASVNTGVLSLRWLGAAGLAIVTINANGAIQFTEVTEEAKLLHTHSHRSIAAFKNSEHAQMSGGAVAEDFNGDGWIDLYVLQGGDSPNLLYINQKDGTFSEEGELRGAALTGYHMGTCAADFDADGDIDIFISGASAPHYLLVNDGSGFFTVDTQQIDLPIGAVTSPSWGDIDNDGLLDLILGGWQSLRSPEPEDFLQIYRNTGNGVLEPYISLLNDWDFVPRFFDMDNDRLQDLLIVADFGKTRWYKNYGEGIFLPAGQSDIQNGMGVATGDIDNDGDLDIFMTSIHAFDDAAEIWNGNKLLLNDGAGGFTDITERAGVLDGAWGWGAEMADFDNDGDLDIFHVTGWVLSLLGGTSATFAGTPSRLFENLGDNTFEDIAVASGIAGDRGNGRCVVVFDYDNDGDQDIFVANNSLPTGDPSSLILEPAPPVLFRNDSITNNNYLKVQLEGADAPHHPHGIGARVNIATGGIEQMRELNASSGFNGHGPRRIAHFGMGTHTMAQSVRAVWTNGDETEIRNVGANQTIFIRSPRATVSEREVVPGETFVVELPKDMVPEGANAVWSIDGVEYSNPASISINEPGIHRIRLSVMNALDPSSVFWSETLLISVKASYVEEKSVARLWNEQNLAAIRIDFPDPTKHARNLFASSLAMWDAWAAYDPTAVGLLHNEPATGQDLAAARREAISYAAYRVISDRYRESVNSSTTLISLNGLMLDLGYDPSNTILTGNTPAALGNRIAAAVIDYTSSDGWEDPAGFMAGSYHSLNEPLRIGESGTTMAFPNNWQPLLFKEALTQNHQPADLVQSFLGPHWGGVRPFALETLEMGQLLHHDPGPPPRLGGEAGSEFKQGNVEVIRLSSLLDPADGNFINISPASLGNNPLGSYDGTGYQINPFTGEPYPENSVNHADYGRILAEFWADGPDSETPPGHWNVLANELHEHPDFLRRFQGQGEELDVLEWDVKLYFAMNGALHDAAIAAWGCKRVYDFVRPISSIRYMGGLGQSSNPDAPSFDPHGLPLIPDLIEVVTPGTASPGQPHAHLADHIGDIAIRAWSPGQNGPQGRVGWIRAVDWLPYQQRTFVTPAFPGYVSGHSTFSRAAAEVLARLTGSIYFPGGISSFTATRNKFLEFEEGPTADVVLQWATYYDAADQAGISRLYGGIHVPVDDLPGRVIGSACGIGAWNLASRYFDGSIASDPVGFQTASFHSSALRLEWNATRGAFYKVQESPNPAQSDFLDFSEWIWADETSESLMLPVGKDKRFFRLIRSFQAP